MIHYSCHPMRDLSHKFRQFIEITDGRDPDEYRGRLRQMLRMGMHCWIAEDNHRIVGTIGFMPKQGLTGWSRNVKMQEAARSKGIDPEKVQVRSLIYVHPEYQGQGIAHELEKRTNKTSRELGFRYRAAFAYDNELIYRWIHRHENAISLDMDDPAGTGLPVSVIPIDKP